MSGLRKITQDELDEILRKHKAWLESDGKEGERAILNGENLREEKLSGANLSKADLRGAFLEGTFLSFANLSGADISFAFLDDKSDLSRANLSGADLSAADLNGANFSGADLSGANFRDADLSGAILSYANLKEADLRNADLSKAILSGADLSGANFTGADMMSANFRYSIADGKTLISECKIYRDTDFRGVGLDNARIDSGIKELLKCNIRRKNWENWYEKHKMLKWIVKRFWWTSDYGSSTERLITVFLISSFFFVALYSFDPEMIKNLPLNDVPDNMLSLRALYFSIVTMTTLGFGDMYAEPNNWLGYIVLIFQVLLGYVLLGALITRLSILFTAEGPSGTFVNNNQWGQRVRKTWDAIKQLLRKNK